jgi:predicted dehydrogenase
MRTAAILGSGFGLYGYLPALIEAGVETIFLPSRYKARFLNRPDVTHLISAVQWMPDETTALKNADTVVLALRPDMQEMWVARSLTMPNIKRLILEKPLAPSPAAALDLHNALINSGKCFRIGYVFRYTIWGRALRSMLSAGSLDGINELKISWFFLAHHFRNNSIGWKQNCEFGGGIIRFYGIQLIALLAEIGYTNFLSSNAFGPNAEEPVKWVAVFSGENLPNCIIEVDSCASTDQFSVVYKKGAHCYLTKNVNPFDVESEGLITDIRIPLLQQLCCSIDQDSSNEYGWYHSALLIWREIEMLTAVRYKPLVVPN